MARILLAGTATLDLVFGLDHPPGADEEMRAQSLRICRGGNAANSAVVLGRLGHQAEFLGVLADAPETAVIERDFTAHGVAFANCPRLPGRPPTSSIYLSGDNRSIVHYRDLPELDTETLLSLDLADYDWLHLEGRNVEVLAEVLPDLRNRFPALPVSLELEKPRQGIEALYAQADVLLCSRGFALYHGHETAESFLQWISGNAAHAMITAAWGAAGAYGRSTEGRVVHAPAVRLERVVDALGAGDTFNAGMIDALLREHSLQEALVHGCSLAGRKCSTHGFDFLDRCKKTTTT